MTVGTTRGWWGLLQGSGVERGGLAIFEDSYFH
jgi:hypothetical protein